MGWDDIPDSTDIYRAVKELHKELKELRSEIKDLRVKIDKLEVPLAPKPLSKSSVKNGWKPHHY